MLGMSISKNEDMRYFDEFFVRVSSVSEKPRVKNGYI